MTFRIFSECDIAFPLAESLQGKTTGRSVQRIRTFLLLIVIAFLMLGCGSDPPLTKGSLEESLCRRGHQFRYKSGNTKWVCWRVLHVDQESSTRAKIRVSEKGLEQQHAKKWFFRSKYKSKPYKDVSRVAVYELKRDSANGKWYVDTSNGKRVRRLWLFKRHLKIKPD